MRCLLNIETQRWESCQCFINSRFYFLRMLLNSWVALKQDLGGETHEINQDWRRGHLKWSCILLLCRVMSPELWVLSLPAWVPCWVSASGAVGWLWGWNRWQSELLRLSGVALCVGPPLHLLRRAQTTRFAAMLFLLLGECSELIKRVTMSIPTWLCSNWCSWPWDTLVFT